jgi:hypothetical protein
MLGDATLNNPDKFSRLRNLDYAISSVQYGLDRQDCLRRFENRVFPLLNRFCP